jgi:prevent-host-death family protein
VNTFNIHDAKTHFSRLVDAAAAGEVVLIAKAGKPVAKLVALKEPAPRRRPGLLKGAFRVPADFDAPLPAQVLEGFDGT